jgi:hypothetical protein
MKRSKTSAVGAREPEITARPKAIAGSRDGSRLTEHDRRCNPIAASDTRLLRGCWPVHPMLAPQRGHDVQLDQVEKREVVPSPRFGLD